MLITMHLRVLYGSQNKQLHPSYTLLKELFLYPKCRVFTVWYALSPYITQIHFVLKGLHTFVTLCSILKLYVSKPLTSERSTGHQNK